MCVAAQLEGNHGIAAARTMQAEVYASQDMWPGESRFFTHYRYLSQLAISELIAHIPMNSDPAKRCNLAAEQLTQANYYKII